MINFRNFRVFINFHPMIFLTIQLYYDEPIMAQSQNQRIPKCSKGRCLLIEMYFCKGYDYGEKVDLIKGYWNPKRKMGVTTHFSEII